VPIPEDMLDEEEYRSILIEAVADYDENCLKKFMEDENSITEEEINIALRAAVEWLSLSLCDCWFFFQKTKSSIHVRCCL
jgi:translation elongation factor EF-G